MSFGRSPRISTPAVPEPPAPPDPAIAAQAGVDAAKLEQRRRGRESLKIAGSYDKTAFAGQSKVLLGSYGS